MRPASHSSGRAARAQAQLRLHTDILRRVEVALRLVEVEVKVEVQVQVVVEIVRVEAVGHRMVVVDLVDERVWG